MRVVGRNGLKERGIDFSRAHLGRLIKSGQFPAPLKIGANTNAWLETEIDAYIRERAAQREARAA